MSARDLLPNHVKPPSKPSKIGTAAKVIGGTAATSLAIDQAGKYFGDDSEDEVDTTGKAAASETGKKGGSGKGRQDGPEHLKPKNLKTKAKDEKPAEKKATSGSGTSGKGRDADLAAKYNPDRRRSGKVAYDPDRESGTVYADKGKDFSKLSRAERARRAMGPGWKSSQADRIADAEKNMVKGDLGGLDRIRKELGQMKSKSKGGGKDIPVTDRMSGPEFDDGSFPKSKKKSSTGLSPGALGGKAKPGLSPGAMGGKVKPKKDPVMDDDGLDPNAGKRRKGGSGAGRQDGPDHLKPKADPMKGAKERMKKRWAIGAKNIST